MAGGRGAAGVYRVGPVEITVLSPDEPTSRLRRFIEQPGGRSWTRSSSTATQQNDDQTHVIGSGNLVRTLLRHDLLDRLNLWIYPVLFGSGKQLFAGGTIPTALWLVDLAAFSSRTVLLTYERAGKLQVGNMAWDADQAG